MQGAVPTPAPSKAGASAGSFSRPVAQISSWKKSCRRPEPKIWMLSLGQCHAQDLALCFAGIQPMPTAATQVTSEQCRSPKSERGTASVSSHKPHCGLRSVCLAPLCPILPHPPRVLSPPWAKQSALTLSALLARASNKQGVVTL